MDTHRTDTDKTKEVKLTSAIERVMWTRLIAAPGGRVGLQVLTRHVGNRAPVKVRLTDGTGKPVGSVEASIVGNRLGLSVVVPDQASGALVAEVSLPKHGLSKTSDALLLAPPAELRNAKWSRDKASRGDALTLSADVVGAPDGVRAEISIWEHDEDGAHDLVTRFPVLVQRGRVQTEWFFSYAGDTADIPTAAERPGGYRPPRYLFRVTTAAAEAESDLLLFEDEVRIGLLGFDGRPLAGKPFSVQLADGSTKQGQTDGEGWAILPDVVPGPVLLLPDEEKYEGRFDALLGAKPIDFEEGPGGAQCVRLRTGVPDTVVVDNREVVPVVFVPGIMGTRLRQRRSGKAVWDPDDKARMLLDYGMFYVDAAERKAALVGKTFDAGFLEVITDDARHAGKHYPDVPEACERGWSEVLAGSYSEVLRELERGLFETDEMPSKLPAEAAYRFRAMRKKFILPVYAFGYNWSDTCDAAGEKLAARITDIIAANDKKREGRRCERVFVVTHSMGGIVTRAACMLHGAEAEALGVLHGVHPAAGSPAAYWRMKAGFERPEEQSDGGGWDWLRSPIKMTKEKLAMSKQKVVGTVTAWTLGTNGEEVTSLLANMPGALELLPNKHYAPKAGGPPGKWLVYDDEPARSLPKTGDPYAEIYLEKEKFYRLIRPDWIAPGAASNPLSARQLDPWDDYAANLGLAKDLHERLGRYVHPNTAQLYSDGIKSVEYVRYVREVYGISSKGRRVLKILMEPYSTKEKLAIKLGAKLANVLITGAVSITPAGLAYKGGKALAKALVQDSDWYINRGGCRMHLDEDDRDLGEADDEDCVFLMTLLKPDGDGDGTVPVSSASMLDPRKNIAVTKKDETLLDRGHEAIYRTETAQRIAFEEITESCLAHAAS